MSRESKATKEEIQRNRDEAYQNGWGDGYAEGFGKATEAAITALPAAPGVRVKPPFHFDRYINGILMAEGVTIEREGNIADAMRVASRIASKGPNGETPVLVLAALSTMEASHE